MSIICGRRDYDERGGKSHSLDSLPSQISFRKTRTACAHLLGGSARCNYTYSSISQKKGFFLYLAGMWLAMLSLFLARLGNYYFLTIDYVDALGQTYVNISLDCLAEYLATREIVDSGKRLLSGYKANFTSAYVEVEA